MGDRLSLLKSATALLSEKAGTLVKSSGVYETEPWGFTTNANFLNQTLKLETTLNPDQLLETCHAIESSLGRMRNIAGEYQSRTMDIDILLYDSLIMDTPHLRIPHPFMHERLFVLKPLSEIAPDYVHPIFQKAIRQLLEECKDISGISVYKINA